MEGEYGSRRSGRGAKIKKKNHQKNVSKNHYNNVYFRLFYSLKDQKKIKQYKI